MCIIYSICGKTAGHYSKVGEYLKISIYKASYGFKLGFNTRPANISKHGEGRDDIRTSNWVISAVQRQLTPTANL